MTAAATKQNQQRPPPLARRPQRATSIDAHVWPARLVPPGAAEEARLGQRRSRYGSRPSLPRARYFKQLRTETS